MSHGQFVGLLVAGLLVAFLVASVAAPPDPFSQMALVGAAMAVVVPVAALLAYAGGYEWLQERGAS